MLLQIFLQQNVDEIYLTLNYVGLQKILKNLIYAFNKINNIKF